MVGNTKRLPVDQTFDGRHLIEKHQVSVLDVVVDGVKVADQQFVFQGVDSSLHQTQVQNTTANFEYVFYNVVSFVLRVR